MLQWYSLSVTVQCCISILVDANVIYKTPEINYTQNGRNTLANDLGCDSSTPAGEEEEEEDIFVGSTFTVGRQDFSIRSMDPITGKERWNVTYSRLGISGSLNIGSKGKPCLSITDAPQRHAECQEPLVW